MARVVTDKTPWPAKLMHAESCSWRFGMNAKCDCGLDEDRGTLDEEDE